MESDYKRFFLGTSSNKRLAFIAKSLLGCLLMTLQDVSSETSANDAPRENWNKRKLITREISKLNIFTIQLP
jgi:hypothetical protein